jgi:hypothetical protein
MISGTSVVFSRRADSGSAVHAHFCATCGSTVFWELDRFPDVIAVAQGMFGDPDYPAPTISVWERYQHPWTGQIEQMDIDRHAGPPVP